MKTQLKLREIRKFIEIKKLIDIEKLVEIRELRFNEFPFNFYKFQRISINLHQSPLISTNLYVFLLISLTLLFSKVNAQEIKPVDQYVKLAAENNPQLKASFNQYLAALEEVPQVGALPDPQVMFGVFVLPVETRVGAQRANFSVSQMFPWFGTLKAQEQVAAEKAKAKLQAFEDEKLSLFKQVKVTYNDVYYLEKSIEITHENLALAGIFQGAGPGEF